MPAFLKPKITSVQWVGLNEIEVVFESNIGNVYHQLYAGREKIGATESYGQRTITALLVDGDNPIPLQVVAVSGSELLTDFGSSLPIRPYNRAKLKWSTSSYPSDAKLFEVTAGTTAGGAVSSSNVIETVVFDGDRTYEIITPALSESGTWFFEVTGRDNRGTNGNAGTALAMSAVVLVMPADFTEQSSGNRFDVSLVAGSLTLTWSA